MNTITLKYVILFLSSLQLYSQSRQDDYFPLGIGNFWKYKYSTYNWEQLGGDYVVKDTGVATYTVLSRSIGTDSILWNVFQIRNISRHYHYYTPFQNIDTTYDVSDSITFYITEYLVNNHRLVSSSNWETVFCFRYDFTDSNSFYRYYPTLQTDTSSFSIYQRFPNNVIAQVIKLSIQKNIGITFSTYNAPGYSGWVPKSNHVLQEAIITSVNTNTDEVIADNFTLSQNYPNPFNPITSFTLRLKKESSLSIDVYDELGKLVDSIIKESLQPGGHTLYWNASNYSSGVYYCVARANNLSKSVKMVLLK